MELDSSDEYVPIVRTEADDILYVSFLFHVFLSFYVIVTSNFQSPAWSPGPAMPVTYVIHLQYLLSLTSHSLPSMFPIKHDEERTPKAKQSAKKSSSHNGPTPKVKS